MMTITNKRIRTGLLTAAIAGGSILGISQVGGIANAQTDDTTADTTVTVEAEPAPTDGSTLTPAERREIRQDRREARQEDRQEVADLLGVDLEEVGEWLQGGGTLADIAEQNGVDPQAVIDLITQQMNDRLDAAVENGRFDADVADAKRAEIEEHVTTRVNEGRPERGEDGARGPGGRRGHGEGAPDDAPADAPADPGAPDAEG